LAALELNRTALNPATFADYMPGPDQYDECRDTNGNLRPAWKPLVARLEAMGPAGMTKASAEIDRLVRESGANFQFSEIVDQPARPWELAAVPLVLESKEWQQLDAGLQQRVRLLEAILADLLGKQELLKSRVLPAELLSANENYYRVYHELPSTKLRLDLTATDLARDKDGGSPVIERGHPAVWAMR
jgi:uncharacterized circularly permuted ATP-grasp superfamily protein